MKVLSVISKYVEINELFNSLEHVTEVYAEPTFSMDLNQADFILLCKQPIDSTKALFNLQEFFSNTVKVYIVYDSFSALLQGKRIIWREGKWFI